MHPPKQGRPQSLRFLCKTQTSEAEHASRTNGSRNRHFSQASPRDLPESCDVARPEPHSGQSELYPGHIHFAPTRKAGHGIRNIVSVTICASERISSLSPYRTSGGFLAYRACHHMRVRTNIEPVTISCIRGLPCGFAHNRRFSCCERVLFGTNRHGPLPGGMGETVVSQST